MTIALQTKLYRVFEKTIAVEHPPEFTCDLPLPIQSADVRDPDAVIRITLGDPELVLPEEAVRIFFHPHYPSRWQYHDCMYYVRKEHVIVLDSNLHASIICLRDSIELRWHVEQCARLLVKRIAFEQGLIYIPGVFLPELSMILSGREHCGRVDVLQILGMHGVAMILGAMFCHKDSHACQGLVAGTALSFTEMSVAPLSKEVKDMPAGCVDGVRLLWVDRWHSTTSTIVMASWKSMKRHMLDQCTREYEYYSEREVEKLDLAYEQIDLNCSALWVGDDHRELQNMIQSLIEG